MVIKGKGVIDQVYHTVGKILEGTVNGKEFLVNDPNIEQKLAYYICKDLGLICGYVDEKYKGDEREWLHGCRRPPRARGLCMKHFQRKYIKYVCDEKSGKIVQKYIFDGSNEIEEKKKMSRIRKRKIRSE